MRGGSEDGQHRQAEAEGTVQKSHPISMAWDAGSGWAVGAFFISPFKEGKPAGAARIRPCWAVGGAAGQTKDQAEGGNQWTTSLGNAAQPVSVGRTEGNAANTTVELARHAERHP